MRPIPIPENYTGPVRIRVTALTGVHHLASGQRYWIPGDYVFHLKPAFRGWLLGQHDAGKLQILDVDQQNGAAGAWDVAPPPEPGGRTAEKRSPQRTQSSPREGTKENKRQHP